MQNEINGNAQLVMRQHFRLPPDGVSGLHIAAAAQSSVTKAEVQATVRRTPFRKLTVEPIAAEELRLAKRAFSTRRVDFSAIRTLVSGPLRPRTGDLLLAQVDRVLYQRRIELPTGRKTMIAPGDRIIVAYGDRYATDQFEAEVPRDLRATHLVATGGVASQMLSRTKGLRGATEITPIGLLGDASGSPLNLRHFAVERLSMPKDLPPVFAVLGTSMNSGKTTTNHAIALGLSRAGLRVGAIKATGTGSGSDYWSMVDAGADVVADFTDAGYSATYKLSQRQLENILTDLIVHVAMKGVDAILVEIADGILQEQNVELIRSEIFRRMVDGLFFAAGEAMGAAFGVSQLLDLGLPVMGVSGKLTASELLIREVAATCDIPVYRKEELSDPDQIREIISMASGRAAGKQESVGYGSRMVLEPEKHKSTFQFKGIA